MNILGAIGSAFKWVFGSTTNGQSPVKEVANIVSNYIPGSVDEHNMNIDTEKTDDASQSAARQMQFVSHDSWFDIIIDGWVRLIRPMFATWGFMVLTGIIDPPPVGTLDPFVVKIIWTIIGFYFGVRTISKDMIPAINKLFKK